MIENLIKLYITTSFTLISFIVLGIIGGILDLKLLVSTIFIFIMLIFVVWFFTAKIVLQLILDGIIDDGDRREKRDKRNDKKN